MEGRDFSKVEGTLSHNFSRSAVTQQTSLEEEEEEEEEEGKGRVVILTPFSSIVREKKKER